MSCLKCSLKECKINAKDCTDDKNTILPLYLNDTEQKNYRTADSLVSSGKAGKLTRVEEIVLYIKEYGYKESAIAYCYSMENEANLFMQLLETEKIKVQSFRCTLGGLKEKDTGLSERENVNCNPIAQAEAVNKSCSEFVIEMGLCLEHDVLFHKYLKKPFTVLAIKDRVLEHKPLNYFKNENSINDDFLKFIDDNFYMKSSEWLHDQKSTGDIPFILDVRSRNEYNNEHIPEGFNIPLKELPDSFNDLPKNKNKTIIAVCNGSVQSAYAIFYLFSIGFINVYNLSGGLSKWKSLYGVENTKTKD